MLYSTEFRRISWWKTVIVLALEQFGVGGDEWHVLTVYDGPGSPVAHRRFTSEDAARRTRDRFVQIVDLMSEHAYASADWSRELASVRLLGQNPEVS